MIASTGGSRKPVSASTRETALRSAEPKQNPAGNPPPGSRRRRNGAAQDRGEGDVVAVKEARNLDLLGRDPLRLEGEAEEDDDQGRRTPWK